MTAITDAEGRVADRQYSYDALSRLAQAQGPYGTIDYTYDGVGNRLTRNADGVADTYTYAPDSHRLQSVTDGSGSTAYTYDATGNTLTKGGGERQYSYDAAGRLSQVDEASAIAYLDDLRYNAHGQRFHADLVRQGRREIYHYDRQGRLIVEMDHSGDPVLREYVYLEGVPLAMFGKRQQLVQGNTGLGELLGGLLNPLTTPLLPTEVFYFHTDHLGTPRLLTDSLGAVVWQGAYKPFGEVIVTTSAVENPLRFPGQRADGSGSYYNYFRDYDPATGRYLESDFIGLNGGLSTYTYAYADPIASIDPFGLEVWDRAMLGPNDGKLDFGVEGTIGLNRFSYSFVNEVTRYKMGPPGLGVLFYGCVEDRDPSSCASDKRTAPRAPDYISGGFRFISVEGGSDLDKFCYAVGVGVQIPGPSWDVTPRINSDPDE